MIRRSITSTASAIKRSAADLFSIFQRPPAQPQFALAPAAASLESSSSSAIGSLQNPNTSPSIADCLWLAVPKRKVTPGKKRMKTTNQKRIKKKNHIIVDSRTGETTLRHRLPFNWKDYLPGN